MRTLTNVFKALSDETRLQMLGLLLEKGELCVVQKPDHAQAQVLGVLPAVLENCVPRELFERLEDWSRCQC